MVNLTKNKNEKIDIGAEHDASPNANVIEEFGPEDVDGDVSYEELIYDIQDDLYDFNVSKYVLRISGSFKLIVLTILLCRRQQISKKKICKLINPESESPTPKGARKIVI